MNGKILKDRENERILKKLEVASIEDKELENWLTWFGHVKRRILSMLLRRTNKIVAERSRRTMNRPKENNAEMTKVS